MCLVSSGAVGMGCQVLRLSERPEAVSKRQALAAIGQGALMRVYTDFFNALSLVRSRERAPCIRARAQPLARAAWDRHARVRCRACARPPPHRSLHAVATRAR